MNKENLDRRRIYAGLKDLRLPDGRRWCGDESNGFPEDDLPQLKVAKKPPERAPMGQE